MTDRPRSPSWKAVLFDFDGTLADSYEAIAASVNHVRSRRGLPPLPVAEVRRYVGRGARELLKDTVPGGDLDVDVSEYGRHHPTVMFEGTRLLDGVQEGLDELKKHDVRMGVCSNKPVAFTRELLRSLGLTDRFAAVLGPEDVPHPKPAPDMLLAALRLLNVRADQALYVGDMVVDVTTARAAGVTVWVLPTGSETRAVLAAARPDRLCETFSELIDFMSA